MTTPASLFRYRVSMSVEAIESETQTIATIHAIGTDVAARRIYLASEIDDSVALRVIATLHVLDRTKGPIYIWLCSPGGAAEPALAIYDALRQAQNNIIVEGYGLVGSAASLIFQAGDSRLLAPQCRFMIHLSRMELAGSMSANETMVTGAEMGYLDNQYQTILAQRSGLSPKRIAAMCARETYLSAAEAVRLGFADGISGIPGKKTKKRKS